MLRDVPGRTAGEFRVELAASMHRSRRRLAFSGASELFERAWYGDVPTGPAESELFRRLERATYSVGCTHDPRRGRAEARWFVVRGERCRGCS